MYTVYTDSVCDWGGDVELCCTFTLCFWPDSEPTKLLHHPKQMTSKDDIKGLVSLSSFVHGGIHRINDKWTVRNTLFALKIIGITLKILKRACPLFRPKTNHICDPKPNPSRETVPLIRKAQGF